MKLEEGMYVRLDRCQGIAKIDEYDDDIKRFKLDKVIYDEYVEETFVLDESDIIKASENMIDLIEDGDYVNGYLVTFVYKPDGDKVFRIELERDTLKGHIISKSEQIKSVVTKEQFESIKYEVE